MRTLFVFHEDLLVGELRLLNEDRYEFEYAPSWCSYGQAFSVSLSLPLQPEVHAHQPTKSFFEGLIPEGDLLRQLEQRSSDPIGS